ncbi:MAG: hypothetical protein K2G63_04800 [Oscillospiraceae bacterium]|nr:hypothetical protein [Oscillospiraceae bacterium]
MVTLNAIICNGDVDCNYSYTDYPELVKKAGLNGYTNSDTVKKSETTLKKYKDITLTVDGVTYSGKLNKI